MRAFFLLLSFFLSPSLLAQQTAYQALRIATKGMPAEVAGALLGAEGLHGATQPRSWRFVFADRAARNGVREIEVSGGEVVTDRTPTNNPFDNQRPIALENLQVDSDSAFTAIENEARRRKIGFYAVSYLLLPGKNSNRPVWRIRLLDQREHTIASVLIDGFNAAVVGSGGASNATDDNTVSAPDSSEPSTELKIHDAFKKTGQSISNGVKHIGGSMQEIFTGERTIDKNTGGN